MNRLWEHNMGDAMRENKQLWRKRRGWMDEGEKRLTDWRSFLGPERDFREMENLRRVRWLVLGCGWLMGLMGCLGTSWGCSRCLRMSFDVPTSPTAHSHTNGGRWDGDPERDSRPLWGRYLGILSSPLHHPPEADPSRGNPRDPERGHPRTPYEDSPQTTLRSPTHRPKKGGSPPSSPHGKGRKKGEEKGGKGEP